MLHLKPLDLSIFTALLILGIFNVEGIEGRADNTNIIIIINQHF